MDVPSISFFGFSAVVALLLLFSKRGPWRRSILVVANLAFLASFCSFDARRLVPFAIFILLGYAAMRFMERDVPKGGVGAGVAIVLISYIILKRYTFVPGFLLPPDGYVAIGISYVVFRIIHLVIDSAQKTLPERISGMAYLSYTINFTALVSGPIQFFSDYRQTEWSSPLRPTTAALGGAFYRIVLGCFKVVVLSSALLWVHTKAIALVSAGGEPWQRIVYLSLAIGIFAPYVYANFSGYTDVVIGVARFLGLSLPENFSAPFSAEGFIEFWTRWHMSLSSWLKRYVYTPLLLTLMRKNTRPAIEPWLAVITYFATFFLVGVWHGRTTEFLCFGFLQGLGVSANKAFQMIGSRRIGKKHYRELCERPIFKAFSRSATFCWFSFSLIWFWATWNDIGVLVSDATPAGTLAALVITFFLAALLYSVCPVMQFFSILIAIVPDRSSRYPAYMAATLCAIMFVATISASILNSNDGPHLVYKAF